jgi:hypothetical protein
MRRRGSQQQQEDATQHARHDRCWRALWITTHRSVIGSGWNQS